MALALNNWGLWQNQGVNPTPLFLDPEASYADDDNIRLSFLDEN